MEQSGGGDNVIYVQVDEQGRVLNYTSNMSGGEQVILLQDSGAGKQPVLVEAPSTSGPMKSPSQISGSTDSVLVSTESQPTSQQEPSCVGDQTTTIPDQPVTTGQIVQAPSTTVVNEPTSQPALVDESGTPVMLIGQPEAVLSSPSVSVTKTVTSPISGAGQRVISTMSSPVVDQSGVPVVVLGTPNPKPAPQVAATGISIINRPQIIPQAGTTNIIKKPVVQRSIVQGQKMVSHFPRVSVPGGSVLISKQGKTYLATPKHIGQPGIVAASQKIGQSTSNLLTNPVIRTPTGPVILSTKAKSSLPKAGVSGVVLVSRPHVQISNAPLILSKQKTTPDTKTAGILNYSPSSMSSITVTQPVLTVIKENPQLRIETAKTHQTSEVTSTVNGTEPEDNEPIEIPDTDEEDSSKGTGNFPSVDVKEKAEETVTEGVLQDVTMNVAKEEEKSEEELMEETNIAEQKEQQSSDEKTQQDMDSDLLMYLGGESVKENEEKVMVSSMTVLEEEKPDDRGGNINDTNEEVVEEAMEIKGEGNKEEEVQMEAEADNVEETAAQVESTTVSDEEFADDEDDGPLPAGLIRGEPIQEHHKMKDVVVEMEHVEMEKDQTGEEVKDNKDEVEKTEDEDLGMEDNSKNAVLNQQEVKLQPEVAEEEEKDRIVSEEATSTQEDDTNQEPSESNIDGRILEAEEEENELQESKSETPGEKLGTRGKGARQRGRGKRGNNSRKDSLDTPEEVHKKSFMANFNLVSPSEMEKLSQRRSKRVSNAEAVKQKEEEGEPSAATGNKVSSTVKNESYKRSETPRSSYKSYKILDDEPSGRQNIFELFDSKDIEKDDSIDSLKARIQKLLAVNAELKTRLRESDHKAASSYTSNARFHEIKALQHKVEKLEKKNSELSQRLESYEGKPSPPERTVDVSFRMGRLSFKSPAGTTQGAATAVVSSPGKPKPTEGQEKPKSRESLEKKEMKLRALDQELDQRTALLKTKEGKLQRLVMDVKSREKKVEYQESALERRVKDIEYRERMLEGKTKAALQKMNKDGGAGGFNKRQPEDTVRSAEMKRFEQELVQRKLKEREAALKEREDAVSEKEKYIEVTEKELAALGADLKEQFHSIKTTGKGIKGVKLSSVLGKGRTQKSPPQEQKDKTPITKVARKSVGRTPTSRGKTSVDNKGLDVSDLASSTTKKRGRKLTKEEDSVSNVSSVKSSESAGKTGRKSKQTEEPMLAKTPKNLIIDMNDKPLSGGKGRSALTRRSIGAIEKAATPKSTLRKRTRTVSPAPVTKKTFIKKARK